MPFSPVITRPNSLLLLDDSFALVPILIQPFLNSSRVIPRPLSKTTMRADGSWMILHTRASASYEFLTSSSNATSGCFTNRSPSSRNIRLSIVKLRVPSSIVAAASAAIKNYPSSYITHQAGHSSDEFPPFLAPWNAARYAQKDRGLVRHAQRLASFASVHHRYLKRSPQPAR